MTQRNTPERKAMLATRADGQRRRHGILTMRYPDAFTNRRTGKPHGHARAKARRLQQIGAA